MEEKNPPIPQPSSKKNNAGGCFKLVLIAFCVIILIGIIASIGGGNNSNSTKSDVNSDSIIVADSISATSEAQDNVDSKQEKTRDYQSQVDEMNDSKSKFASIVSDNIVNFDFPYQGGSDMTITVRNTKKWGTDVYISISKGQFICNEYNGTNYVRIRFDNGTPIKFTTNEPSDGSSDLLFLTNRKKFINLAKKAKRILIEAPFYQEGNQVFTFTVDKPLEW